jgi:hypothetical protein
VPDTDKFQRVLELEADDFRFDPGYPDVAGARSEDFVLIEILWSVGRSVKVKKKLLAELMTRCAFGRAGSGERDGGVQGDQLGNWAFAGGGFCTPDLPLRRSCEGRNLSCAH